MIQIVIAEEILRVSAQEGIDASSHFLYAMRARNVPDIAFSPNLLALEDLKRWTGEVDNGGHSQFLGNKRERAAPMLRRIAGLLRNSGAERYASIAERAADWILENPAEAACQTGFGDRIAKALEALDQEYREIGGTKPLAAGVLGWLRSREDIRLVPLASLETEIEREALRAKTEMPEVHRWIVRAVADECRQWLSDPFNIGVSLASGKVPGGHLFTPFSPEAPAKQLNKTYVALVSEVGGQKNTEPGYFLCDEQGVRIYKGLFVSGEPVVEVTRREIERASKMALAFRLPESVALRWMPMGREFSINVRHMQVMPGSRWRPDKWRILWHGGASWAVKGSPNRSTFMNLDTLFRETLMQEDIATRIADLGLRIGG